MYKGLDYKKQFLLLYFIMILSVMLDTAGGFPFTSILRKFKYIYVALGGLFCFYNVKNNGQTSLLSIVTWLLFFFHTVLWGFFFVNPVVSTLTVEHVQQMVWFLLMVLVTFLLINQYNLFYQFIETSFIAISIVQIWAIIRHIGDIRHPKFWLSVLGIGSYNRWKASFGFSDANFCGYYCMASIILSVFIINKCRKSEFFSFKNKKVLIVFAFDIVSIVMLFSSGSRSNVLSILIFLWFYLYKNTDLITKTNVLRLRSYMNIVMIIFVIVLIFFGNSIFSYVWSNSNRELNLDINFAVFKEMDSWLFGMGYVESNGFAQDVFGYDTWNIDMYYQYIFFSTGLLGITFIGTALVIMLNRTFFNRKNDIGYLIFIMYISMLFNAFWQVNICTYRFYPSLILMSILLCGMSLPGNLEGGSNNG